MKQYVIVGNSAAGVSAVEAIRSQDKTSKIVVVSDEDCFAYCRCLISNYLASELEKDKLLYRREDFYKENSVELILNKKAEYVDTKKNQVLLEDKTKISYDYLLIATGASPKFPSSIVGIKKKDVLGFRTLKDAEKIKSILTLRPTVCILGGGLIGLKVATSLAKKKVEVKVIVKSKQILSQILDFESAKIVQDILEKNGVEIILGTDVVEIIGNGDIKAVKLDSGKIIACSLVIVAKGVSPNINLVKDTPIKIDEGILANECMQTNIPNIYTAGDVCQTKDLVSQQPTINALWPIAVEEARIAGLNMTGKNLIYEGSLGMNSVDFFGLPIISMGVFAPKEDKTFQEFVYKDPKQNIYKKVVLKDNRLVGAILINQINTAGLLLRLIKEKVDVSYLKNRLLASDLNYADIREVIKEKELIYV